ncbi:MAG: hypothetical protein ACRD4S_05210 [Candidatus Acidiferrales bacterium]
MTNGNVAQNEPPEAHTPQSLRALTTHLVDYAGLFPPACLRMREAVSNYHAYIESDMAWALGRFIVPASRLPEFDMALDPIASRRVWRLSCLIGDNPEADLAEIDRFNNCHERSRAVVDAVEVNLRTVDKLHGFVHMVPRELTTYFEVLPDVSTELYATIQAAGARAKIRTGGVNPNAIPATGSLACFLARCAAAGAGFKATAGLHHPLRCVKALTSEPNSICATMHGFLNVFLAACFARDGASEGDLAGVIDSQEAASFHFDDAEARWRNSAVTTEQIRDARKQFAISFGSCSFEEPIEGLRSLQLL